MTDKTRADFEAWLDEPHPADEGTARRDYMPKNDGGFTAMVWQAATEQGKRQPLTDDGHRCSYFCDLPACVKKQRDDMRNAMLNGLQNSPTLKVTTTPQGNPSC